MRYTSAARPLTLLTLAAVALAGSGCRSATDAPCPTSVTTIVGSNNNVVPNTASASVQTVSRPGGTLPGSTRVQSIEIRQGDVQFTGTGTGTVDLALAVNGYLITVGTLNISNGAVAGITPATSTPGQFAREQARAIIEALPEAQRASLNLRSIDDLSEAQFRDALSAAVREGAFVLAVLTRTTGVAQGSVIIQRITFHLAC